jgi:hypothetical protein
MAGHPQGEKKMKQRFFRMLAAVCLVSGLLFTPLWSPCHAAGERFAVFFSANGFGELQPCGG